MIPTLREKLFKNRERKGSLSENYPGVTELTDFRKGKRLSKRIRITVFKGMREDCGDNLFGKESGVKKLKELVVPQRKNIKRKNAN